MGFGVRLAPGVRIRVSSRGVRTSVGPRIARVHVGAGRTGFSTGVGPISYYTSVGGSRRSYAGSSGGSSGGYSGSYSSTYGTSGRTQHEKYAAATEIEETLKRWTKAHLKSFPKAKKEIAALAETPTLDFIFKQQKKIHLDGISIFKLSERKVAKEKASAKAQKLKEDYVAEAKADQAKKQAEIDDAWARMEACEASEIYTRITDAFGDNESKAAVIDVAGKTVSILVLVPGIEVLPEKDRSHTAAGNLSVRKMTAAAKNNYYLELVNSQAIATAKEALAECPSLDKVKLLVIRNASTSSKEDFECIAFGTIGKSALDFTSKNPIAATLAIGTASNDWNENLNGKQQLLPLDLSKEPEIMQVLKDIGSGQTEYGKSASDHVGVVINENTSKRAQTPPAKAKAPSRPAPRRTSRQESPEKIRDENLAIQVLIYCSSRQQITKNQISTLTELKTKELKQLIEFLTLVGVFKRTKTADVFEVICGPEDVESLSNDIRDSISFRSMYSE